MATGDDFMLITRSMDARRPACKSGRRCRTNFDQTIRRQPLIWRRRQATQSGGESGIFARSTLNCWQFLILQAKPQLIEVELLGTRAKPMTQQTLDQQQQLLVLGCSSGTTSRSTAAMAAASPTPPPPCLHLQ
jgi:hypothetical protein